MLYRDKGFQKGFEEKWIRMSTFYADILTVEFQLMKFLRASRNESRASVKIIK